MYVSLQNLRLRRSHVVKQDNDILHNLCSPEDHLTFRRKFARSSLVRVHESLFLFNSSTPAQRICVHPYYRGTTIHPLHPFYFLLFSLSPWSCPPSRISTTHENVSVPVASLYSLPRLKLCGNCIDRYSEAAPESLSFPGHFPRLPRSAISPLLNDTR